MDRQRAQRPQAPVPPPKGADGTRRPGESVRIGDDIEVFVMSVHGGQVKIGVKAPDRLDFYRNEVYERIEQEETNWRENRAK